MDYLKSIEETTVAFGYNISFEPILDADMTPEIRDQNGAYLSPTPQKKSKSIEGDCRNKTVGI